jgi:hypothetical protein
MQFIRTGEHRPPKKGEWFAAYGDVPQIAWCNFTIQSFDILTVLKKGGNRDYIVSESALDNEEAP